MIWQQYGNEEKPVGKCATNKLDETESGDTKEEEKSNQKGQTTEKRIIKKKKKEKNDGPNRGTQQ